MERQSLVQTLEISEAGTTYTATYYINNGTIHADVAGKLQIVFCGALPAHDFVAALLAERVMELTANPMPARR